MEQAHHKRQIFVQGRVVSNSMNKTVVMTLESRKRHPKFKKIVRSTSKIKVHDEKNECGVGDLIMAVETRPLSRDKHHKLVKIVEKAKV